MGLATQLVGHVMVVVHDDQDPTDAEWTKFVATVQKLDVANLKYLISTQGGRPNALQRQKLREVGGAHLHKIRAAILSDDPLVKAVTYAFSFFVPGVRALRNTEMAEALDFLGVPSAEYQRIGRIVVELQERLSQRKKP